MSTRRLAPSALLVVVLLAGCAGLISGGEPVSVTADRVTVEEGTVSEAGFRLVSDEPVAFERSVSVAGRSRTVEARVGMVHLRGGNEGFPTQVVVLSVPAVEVVGQRLSLVEEIGPMSLVRQVRDSAGDLESDRKIGERQVRILGSDRTAEVFSGTATRDGNGVEVRTVLTSFTHRGDTIVAVGVVPETVPEGTESVLGVLEGIERPSS